ncbi:MAG: ParB/RepB/Spo0J family partition protein [Planctomycetaceae bacterium]|nr:ParB/RepB/Spo0J family partition protein [Planctomycetaceae bacterium]
MAKEKRLGRGLEALLGKVGGVEQNQLDEINGGDMPQNADSDWLLQQHLANQRPDSIDILLIEPNPFQPRREFDESEIEQLAGSLQTHGLLQPVVVRRIMAGDTERFQIIAGERRYRAAMRLGWQELPVHCLEADDRTMIELAITENVQRKDLNAIEKAIAFAQYLESYGGTHDELAKRLELDRSTVTNLVRLLELDNEVQESVRKGELTMGHARALLALEKFEQVEIGNRIKTESWSVRETERFVRELIDSVNDTGNDNIDNITENEGWKIIDQEGNKRKISKQSEQIIQLEEELKKQLGGVKIKLLQKSDKGNGKLIISFANHNEFERIYSTICKNNKATG